jgi:hypothetical protein
MVRADSELALARLLGLAPARGAGARGNHPLGAGVVAGLLFGLALVLMMVSLGAVL